jgi:hypothetical protein
VRTRTFLAAVATAALLVGTLGVSVVAAGDTSRPASAYDASVRYQSDPTLLGPGVHTRMSIHFATDGSGYGLSIQGDGWDNGPSGGGMLSDWSWAYEKSYPMEPAIGGVSATLMDAWVHSDTLTFQCWTPGKCPPMPAEIIVEGKWTGLGQMTADVFRDSDDFGAEWLRISRSRTAAATFEFTYPAGDGPLPIPALLMGASISSYHYTAEKGSTATPLISTKTFDTLWVRYDTLPEFQQGTHDTLEIMLGHSTWTENGVVTYDWYNFEMFVGQAEADANGLWTAVWAGAYYPQIIPVEPISFSPRTASATRTLRWQCFTHIGDCPTMPSPIEVTITGTAVGGPPRVETMTGPGSPGPATSVFKEYDAAVILDTGGEITQPPLVTWSWLQHGQSRTVEH